MIQTRTDGGVRTITLDRPGRRNALTHEGLDDLDAAVNQAGEPVLFLTGAGEAFCAGADLDVVRSLAADEAAEFARQGQRVARAIEDYDGAVVAGIDGAARGGGVELALACDVRVATPDATLAESGVSLGLFGAWGGTARLARIVGQGEAMDLALSGRVLDAEEAKQMGLVSRVTADTVAVAHEIAANDPAAVRKIKKLLQAEGTREARERQEADAFRELIGEFNSK